MRCITMFAQFKYFLVGHGYTVQRGPTDSPHLPDIDLEHLPMEGECEEVEVGIGVELHKRACHL